MPCHLLLLGCSGILVVSLQVCALAFIPFRGQPWVPGAVQFLFRRGLGALLTIWRGIGLIRFSMEGRPVSTAPAVFVANHPSFVDALFLIPFLPRTVCLYRASLEGKLIPRSLVAKAGFIANTGNATIVRESVARLREGSRILLFPEGTRTSIPPMGLWKSSYALIAARAQAPVQPIYLEMSSPFFPKGVPWWKPPEFPVRVRIRFGLSMPPPGEHTVRHFHHEVEASFRHELIQHQAAPELAKNRIQ